MRTLLGAVYGTLRDVEWHEQVEDADVVVLRGSARIGPIRLGDAMWLELDREGRIQRVRPHLRPWLGLSAFAVVVGAKMLRHPAIILRALRAR